MIAAARRAGRPRLLALLAVTSVVVAVSQLGACSIPTSRSEAPLPTPSVSDSTSAQVLEIERARLLRAALAAEVLANTQAETEGAAERLQRISDVIATTGTVAPPTTDSSTTSTEATIDRVLDGDTVVTSTGATVRIIGIDAPEAGLCGSEDAAALLRGLVEGKSVTLVNPTSVDDADKYGRILRYVDTGAAVDVSVRLLEAGFAVARYDYLDGYDWHPRQDAYRALDAATAHVCGAAAEDDPAHILAVAEPEPIVAPAPVGLVGIPDASAEPWNLPGPDLDCKDIGHRVTITGEDYHHLDADGDGVGCESWG